MSNLKFIFYFKLLQSGIVLLEPNQPVIYCTGDKECAVRCANLFYLPNVPEAVLLDSHFKLSRRVGRSLTFNFTMFAVVRVLCDKSCCCFEEASRLATWWANQYISIKTVFVFFLFFSSSHPTMMQIWHFSVLVCSEMKPKTVLQHMMSSQSQ